MFQEKEMYFFESNSNTVNSQKVVIIPKLTTGELLTDNLYDIIEENTRMTLFESKIIPKDMITCKRRAGEMVMGNNNYYFENPELCEKVGFSQLLEYFRSPRCISYNLQKYIEKTDEILKKIIAAYSDCKKLEMEIIDNFTRLYSTDKITYVAVYEFLSQSLDAINFITGHSFRKIGNLNKQLEDIKHILLYKEKRNIIDVLNLLMDVIIQYDDILLPITYCEEITSIEQISDVKFQKFFIETDDINEFIDNVRSRKNKFLDSFTR
jgi:hypothetical protein